MWVALAVGRREVRGRVVCGWSPLRPQPCTTCSGVTHHGVAPLRRGRRTGRLSGIHVVEVIAARTLGPHRQGLVIDGDRRLVGQRAGRTHRGATGHRAKICGRGGARAHDIVVPHALGHDHTFLASPHQPGECESPW